MADKTKTETKVSTLPAWQQEYYANLLGRSQSLLDRPYETYDAARIAGFTPEQEQAFEMVRQGIGGYLPQMGAASGALSGALGGGGGSGAAGPYLSTAANQRALTTISPYLEAGTSTAGLAASMPYLTAAASGRAADAASPYVTAGVSREGFDRADPYLARAGIGSAYSAASPYLTTAGRTFPSAVDEYMNPYNARVTDRIPELAARNLRENILPELNRTFVGGGTFGGKRSFDFTNRAVRDTQEAALAEQNKALQAGYGQAADIFASDASRAVQSAQTAGQLSQADLERALATGKSYADISNELAGRQIQSGQLMGQLTQADLERGLAAGKSIADIYADQATRQLTAGQVAGSAATSDAGRLVDIGRISGDIAGADQQRQIEAAQAAAEMALQEQQMRLADAAALAGVGAQQQGLSQTSADLAYADAQAQKDYDWQQLQKASSVATGLPATTSTTGSSTEPGPSALSQATGLATAGIGLWNAYNDANDGNGGGSIGDSSYYPATYDYGSGYPADNSYDYGNDIYKHGGHVRPRARPKKQGLGWLKDLKNVA